MSEGVCKIFGKAIISARLSVGVNVKQKCHFINVYEFAISIALLFIIILLLQ